MSQDYDPTTLTQILTLLVSDYTSPLYDTLHPHRQDIIKSSLPIVFKIISNAIQSVQQQPHAQQPQEEEEQPADSSSGGGKGGVTLEGKSKEETNPNSQNEKYRRIRLGNAIIHKHVVSVVGVVDLLTLMGFVHSEDGGNDSHIVTTDTTTSTTAATTTTTNKSSSLDPHLIFIPTPKNIQIGNLILSELRPHYNHIQGIIPTKNTNESSSTSTKTDITISSSSKQTTFLSQEERKQRYKKGKTQKQADKAAKERVRLQWEQDQQDRLEKKQRRARAAAAAAASAAEMEAKKKRDFKGRGGIIDGIQEHDDVVDDVVDDASTQPNATPVESLQALRSKAAQAWHAKHSKPAKNAKKVKTSKSTPLPFQSPPLKGPPKVPKSRFGDDEDVPMEEDAVEQTLDKPLTSNVPNTSNTSNTSDEVNMDCKPAAVTKNVIQPSASLRVSRDAEVPLLPSWEECIRSIPRCAATEGIRDTSVFYRGHMQSNHASTSSTSPTCFRRLFTEFAELETSLPSDQTCSAWLRYDEETPQYIRFVLTAPLSNTFVGSNTETTDTVSSADANTATTATAAATPSSSTTSTKPISTSTTPYSGGIFVFDMYIPDTYPKQSPSVQLRTTGGGSVRFGPNLYADGKVCLSLLGTWNGPRWNENYSSLHQVLVSIQGLILGVEHPYFLEPGHGGWEGNIKEGEFTSMGQTCSGEVVTEEVNLPPEASVYEDTIRLGTIRYALMEPLKMICAQQRQDIDAGGGDVAMDTTEHESTNHGKHKKNHSLEHLLPFQDVMKIHFYHNGDRVLKEVWSWLRTSRPTLKANHDSTNMMTSHLHSSEKITKSMEALFPKLESLVAKVQSCPPLLNQDTGKGSASLTKMDVVGLSGKAGADDGSSPMDITSHSEKATVPTTDAVMGATKPTSSTNESENNTKQSELDLLREQMKNAATAGNFILAGKLQKEIQQMEKYDQDVQELKQKIQAAANVGDFIKAGEYQAQLKVLEKNAMSSSTARSYQPAKKAALYPNQYQDDDSYQNEYEDENEHEEDDSMDEDDDYEQDKYSSTPWNHGWGHRGKGQILNSDVSDSKPPATATAAAATKPDVQMNNDDAMLTKEADPVKSEKQDSIQRLPINESCRLRIRLPGFADESILEEFDSSEKLLVVYKVIKSKISDPTSNHSASSRVSQLRGMVDKSGNQAVAMHGSAFSNPISEYGFTLLSAHPKREYSLELHGSTSLKDLGMTPSATLTVMPCSDRGRVKRGVLEQKLAEAQGDAMDVDNLGYEALQELVEQIGTVVPGGSDGMWKGLDEERLDTVSTLTSPKDYLSQKSCHEEDGQDSIDHSRCPICLGEFDPNESELILRTLNHCGHTFHSSCLKTWLSTKTNCPICNHSLNDDA